MCSARTANGRQKPVVKQQYPTKKSLLLSTTLPFMDWNEVITFFLCMETIPMICVQDGRLETRMGVSKRDKIWIFPLWRHSSAFQLRRLKEHFW
jgi:hypothetical protein